MENGKRYYWLRLMADFFSQPRIKKLRRIAGGDTYTVIYLKLQLLSLRTDGVLFFEGIEESFAEELALTLDEDPENVAVTLRFLEAQQMLVQRDDGGYILPETQGLIGAEGYSAERMRRYRDRKKASPSDATVTKCDGTSSLSDSSVIGGDEEKEKNKRKSREEKESIDYQQIVDNFNLLCPSLPRVTRLSDARKRSISARLRGGYSVEDLDRAFKLTESSDFLTGKNDRGWRASFDWVLKESNLTKVLDGQYENRNGVPQSKAKPTGFTNFQQRDYDFDELEKQLLGAQSI